METVANGIPVRGHGIISIRKTSYVRRQLRTVAVSRDCEKNVADEAVERAHED